MLTETALTTIRHRSFAGPRRAQFASTLVVCAGLLLLLAATMSSDRDALSATDPSACADSPDAPRDHQWTDDAGINAPDSCDDDDSDNDGDDEGAGGSGQAIAATQRAATHLGDAFRILHVQIDRRAVRPLDAHSLRGPPSVHQESSDADVDDDDDDDSLGAHHSAPLAANSREPDLLASANPFHSTSTGSGHALRAPPQ